jgi:Tfp pilus assembly protein PilO
MDRMLTVKRRLILAGLTVLLIGDLALAGYSWHTANTLRRPMAQLVADSRKLQLLRADVDRADRIRHDLPATVADCEHFEGSLLPASTGNSAITAELDELAKKSGLQIQSVAFRHKDLVGRNLTEVELDVLVTGDYLSIVRFMNGLQQSRNSFAVDSLTLQAEGQNQPNGLRVALHMKTYFRTTA